MPRRGGQAHVATIKTKGKGGKEYTSYLLRRSYREGGKVRHENLGNLSHLPLEVIVSPHRALVAPLVNYLWSLHRLQPDLTLTVAVPEIVARRWWHRILHDHVALRLQRALKNLPGVVVTSVPFHLTD